MNDKCFSSGCFNTRQQNQGLCKNCRSKSNKNRIQKKNNNNKDIINVDYIYISLMTLRSEHERLACFLDSYRRKLDLFECSIEGLHRHFNNEIE